MTRAASNFARLLPAWILLIFLDIALVHSQIGWHAVTGDGITPHLLTVTGRDSLRYFAAGFAGTLLSTSDGGKSWDRINTGVSLAVRGVWFQDDSRGMIIGDSGLFLRTNDGGASWETPPGTPFSADDQLIGLAFFSPDHGFVAAAGGHVYSTSNGGGTWTDFDLSEERILLEATALEGSLGVIGGTRGRIYVTANSGTTWSARYIPGGCDVFAVCINPAGHIYAAGQDGLVLKSADNGITWFRIADLTMNRLTMIHFISPLDGFAGSSDGELLRTTDGGVQWSSIGRFNKEISDIATDAGGRCVLVPLGSNPYFSTNGGMTWTGSMRSGRALLGVSTAGAGVAAAVGTRGWVLKSTDTGISWTMLSTGTSLDLYGIHCWNSSDWTAVGDSGIILKTTDGGGSWTRQQSGTARRLRRAEYVSSLTGWAAGDSGTVLRTLDGGNTWTPRSSPMDADINGIDFLDDYRGLIVGAGAVLRTTNSGASWLNLAPSPTGIYRAVCVGGDSNVVTGGSFPPWNGVGPTPMLQSSDDLGVTWRFAQGMFTGGEFFDIAKHDPSSADAVGTGGRIYRTSNGGISWGNAWSPVGSTLRGIGYAGSMLGYAVGDEGVILRTIDAGHGSPPALVYPAGVSVDFGTPIVLSWKLTQGNTGIHVQLSRDPTFMTGILMDSVLPGPSMSVSAPPLLRSERYFWRVRRETDAGPSGWSIAAAFYTSGIRLIDVRAVQFCENWALSNATFTQNSDPARYWWYQATQVSASDTFSLSAVCVIPPNVIRTGAPFSFLISDLNSASTQWNGVLVEADSSLASDIEGIREGDVVTIDGIASESPPLSMNSATVVRALSIHRTGTAALPDPVLVQSTDFYEGVCPDGRIRFDLGEAYEGMIVKLHDLVVDSVLDSAAGTFNMTDRAGNSIQMTDISEWFTYRSHRNPASTYVMPRAGEYIDTIRGIVTTAPGPSGSRGYALAPVYPGDLSISPHPNGVIEGTIYLDSDGDGVRDPQDTGVSRWKVNLTGSELLTAWTGPQGTFRFSALDSARYSLSPEIGPGWSVTEPDTSPRIIPLGLDSTATDRNFGVHYSGNSVSGTIFDDRDGNAVKDAGEPPLPSWPVFLDGYHFLYDNSPGPTVHSVTLSDADGYYRFENLAWGIYTITIADSVYWFVTEPDSVAAYRIETGHTWSQPITASGRDFGLVRQVKLRSWIDIEDRRAGFRKKIYWGIIPGASYGIWRADPAATRTDTLEGEFEIPPRSFAEWVGMFDARFSDPRYPVGIGTDRFGEGSWTDVRDYIYPEQSDSFLVSFLPSYMAGGGYPIRLRWNSSFIAQSFRGDVTLRDIHGATVNMKTEDSLVVSDTSISWFKLTASAPEFPNDWRAQWRLISLPGTYDDVAVTAIYRSAMTPAYALAAAGGYEEAVTLSTGRGYWLKYRPADTISYHSPSRTTDTIHVNAGWNLIGTLSVPLWTGAARTNPPGIIVSSFYGFDRGYVASDILQPSEGYWVLASGEGDLILGITGVGQDDVTAGSRPQMPPTESPSIELHDAAGNRSVLWITADETLNPGRVILPPVPPEGCFDIRTPANSLLAYFAPGRERTIPLRISSARYPITLRWDMPEDAPAYSLLAGEIVVPLRGRGSAEISDPSLTVSLMNSAPPAIPAAYALEQNYPNPFNPSTTIVYALPKESRITLKVYDILGREIEVLVNEVQGPGYRSVKFAPASYPSGIYFYRLTAGEYSAVRKMMLIR